MGDPVTSEQAEKVLVEWFLRVGVAGLVLPSGWFGRPYDDQFRLTGSAALGERLVVCLDDNALLAVLRPGEVVEENERLVIRGFDQVVWAFSEYGSRRSHVQVFDRGAIELVGPRVT